ncbi:PadR family transcriptional regulator [Micromonospora rifamycinica]|uniref:PadR family transcriptional regulator n=1 Tax=Micromonospora rifamycinica TaxID=291594 RepID=UPI0033D73A72
MTNRHVHLGPDADPPDMPPPPLPPLPPPPPPMPMPPPPGRVRRPVRMRRGDVRAALLSLLHEQPGNGYQLIQAITDRSGGRWRPSPGSVYPTLSQLEEEGLVATTGSGAERRCHLTDAGRAFVTGDPDRAHEPWAEAARLVPDAVVEVRAALDSLTAAVHQVATAGTDEQLDRTGRVLESARRDVYRILAGDDVAR